MTAHTDQKSRGAFPCRKVLPVHSPAAIIVVPVLVTVGPATPAAVPSATSPTSASTAVAERSPGSKQGTTRRRSLVASAPPVALPTHITIVAAAVAVAPWAVAISLLAHRRRRRVPPPAHTLADGAVIAAVRAKATPGAR